MKTKSVQIKKEIHSKVKIYSALQEKGMSKVIEEAIETYMRRNEND